MLIQIKNQDDIILLSLRKTIKTKKLLKGVFSMRKLNSTELTKVNGGYYIPFYKEKFSDKEFLLYGITHIHRSFGADTFYTEDMSGLPVALSRNEAETLVSLSCKGLVKPRNAKWA